MSAKAILLASFAAVSVTPAFAQSAPADSAPVAESDAGLDTGEIIVTARSRAESIQDVPLAITAFTEDDLERRGLQDLQDLGQFTPGFTFETYGGGFGTAVIRGTQQAGNSLEGNVAPFYDGIYLPRGYITDLGFASLERVEIVKGPQSARYGRNAFMGVINYIPKRPTEELRVEGEVTVGNHDRYDGAVSASGALVPGILRVSAGVDYSTFDGSWRNPHPFADIDFDRGTNTRMGGWERLSYNAAVQLQPIDELTIDASYRHFDVEDESPAINFFGELNANSQKLNCGVSNRSVRPFSGDWLRLFCGTLPVEVVGQDPRGYSRRLTADIFRFSANWAISDAVTVNYLFGRVEAETDTLNYKDVLPGCTFFISGQCIFESGPIGELTVDSHEVRVNWNNGGPITLATGGYITDERDVTISNVASLPVLTAVPDRPVAATGDFLLFIRQGDTLTTSKIKSIFGEFTWEILEDRARIGVEARYSEEKKTANNRVTSLVFSDTFKSFTPRITAEYDLTDENKLFASAAKGVKSGGFNSNSFLPENRTYGQESNWTYEIGTRNRFLNGRATLNLTAFYIDWSAVQIPAQNIGSPNPLATSIVLNLGEIKSRGFELDGAFAPSDIFNTYFTLSYTDAEYAKGTIDRRWGRTPAVCDNIVCNANGDIGGNTNQNSPKWQGSLGGELHGDISAAEDLSYYVRADLGYRGKAPAEAVNLAYVAARTVVNASVGLIAGNVEARLWARNLLDEKYVSNAFVGQPNTQYVSRLGDRRTIGITVRAAY